MHADDFPLCPGGPQDAQHDHGAGDAADGARLDELVETVREGELSPKRAYQVYMKGLSVPSLHARTGICWMPCRWSREPSYFRSQVVDIIYLRWSLDPVFTYPTDDPFVSS